MARKILLADDSVTAQNMGRKILIDAGYDVLTVNNGSAALKRIAESKPDLIVLDVYMPGYSGLEVCQRLKDAPETAHIPVLLTVGKLEPFKPQEARRVKADAHIVKPFEASELLSAIAKLEDNIVPQANTAIFCSPVTSGPRFDEGYARPDTSSDPDTSWKTRLRSPSKKKKTEPEPEADLDEPVGYRDSRKNKKSGAIVSSFGASARTNEEQPAAVPDIPRDITPEELDALSALAKKLDEPAPIAPTAPSLAQPSTPSTDAPPASFAQAEGAQNSAPIASMASEASSPVGEIRQENGQNAGQNEDQKKEDDRNASALAPSKIPDAVSAPAAENHATELAVTPGNEVEIPVAQLEPGTAVAAADFVAPDFVTAPFAAEAPSSAEPSQVESSQIEASKTPEAQAFSSVDTASFAQLPAPIDQQDEPMFAAAPVEEKAEERIAVQPAPVDAVSIASPPPEAKVEEVVQQVAGSDVARYAEAKTKAPETEVTTAEVAKAEDKTDAKTVEAAAINAKPVAAEVPVPSDEELAEALRLLTPAPANADSAISTPSHGTLVAAGQLLAEEAAREASAGKRWVAQALPLTPEDAALSLEAEMFRTFAAASAAPSTAIESATAATGSSTTVSMIAAAVENRLAQAGMPVEATSGNAPRALAVAAGAENAAAENSPAPPPEAFSSEASRSESPSSEAQAPQATSAEDTAIAGIVDRVLADLRPRIVEEIARKLSSPK